MNARRTPLLIATLAVLAAAVLLLLHFVLPAAEPQIVVNSDDALASSADGAETAIPAPDEAAEPDVGPAQAREIENPVVRHPDSTATEQHVERKPESGEVRQDNERALVGDPVRFKVPKLSWDPDVPLEHEGGPPELDRPEEDLRSLHKHKHPPETLLLDIAVRDAATTEFVLPATVEVVDRSGKLRVAAEIVESPSGPTRQSFFLSYREDDTFLIRAKAGDKVGYSIVGTGYGSPMIDQDLSSHPSGQVGQERRFRLAVVVWVSTQRERQEGATLRVADSNGAAVEGATAYYMGSILGQTDANGTMAYVVAPWHSKPLVAVHYPGKVPVFLKPEDAPTGRVTEVVLHADELVVSFYLLMKPELLPKDAVVGNPWSGPGGRRSQQDRGVYPPGVDPRNDKRWWRWNIDSLGYSKHNENYKALEEAVRRPLGDDKVLKYYNYWYNRQWKYNESTGNWQVVIPHPGRYIIALAEDLVATSSPTSDWVMYPGLYIDATDPANPKVELIYPE